MLRSRLLALTFSVCLGQPYRPMHRYLPGSPSAPAGWSAAGGTFRRPRHSSRWLRSYAASVGFAPRSRNVFDRRQAGNGDREDRIALAKFYGERKNEPVWITPAGLQRSGPGVHAEIGRAGDWGLDASTYRLPALVQGTELRAPSRADAEIALSLAILKYARHARGGRAEPTSLSRNLDRKLPLLDPRRSSTRRPRPSKPDAYLRSCIRSIRSSRPCARSIWRCKRGGSRAADPNRPWKPTARASARRRVGAGSGRAPSAQAARQHGGVALDARALGDFYVWVNVPEYHAARRQGRQGHPHRARHRRQARDADADLLAGHGAGDLPPVLGRAGVHQDATTSCRAWRAAARASSALQPAHPARRARHRSGDRRLGHAPTSASSTSISRPGANNVLGIIKFRFPNKHDVYMHDTPSKSCSTPSVRAFSHGCMRVRDPQRLAELLLAEDQGWPAQRVAAAIGRRAAEQPDQPRPQGPRAHHLFHRHGRATTASSSCSPTSTATRAASRSAWRARRISSRARRRRPFAPRRSAASPRRTTGGIRARRTGCAGVFRK